LLLLLFSVIKIGKEKESFARPKNTSGCRRRCALLRSPADRKFLSFGLFFLHSCGILKEQKRKIKESPTKKKKKTCFQFAVGRISSLLDIKENKERMNIISYKLWEIRSEKMKGKQSPVALTKTLLL
jgi:hypothetical protein